MAAGREVKSFIDGGYGEKVSGAAANGDYESAVGYTVAGALFGTMNVLSFGEAGAIANSARAIGSKLVAGQGGRFANLVGTVGDDLTAHHIPQAALKFTSRADGGAVVMTTAEHEATRTFGFKGALTAAQDSGNSFRTILANDIRDVRSIVGNKYNEGLKNTTNYYREHFPDLMRKSPRTP
jgi:hypothetical protein